MEQNEKQNRKRDTKKHFKFLRERKGTSAAAEGVTLSLDDYTLAERNRRNKGSYVRTSLLSIHGQGTEVYFIEMPVEPKGYSL